METKTDHVFQGERDPWIIAKDKFFNACKALNDANNDKLAPVYITNLIEVVEVRIRELKAILNTPIFASFPKTARDPDQQSFEPPLPLSDA